jgi:methyl-accepting chemotaxis protein
VSTRAAILVGYVVSMAVITAAVAVFTARSTEARLSAAVRREVISYARAAATEVDPAVHARAAAGRSWDSAEYAEIEARLRSLRDAWRESGIPVRFVFTLVPDRASPSGAVYAVDAAERGPDKSKCGEEMRFFEREDGKVDWTEAMAIRYSDAYGTFFSGFAPVRDDAGQVVLVAGIDLDAASVSAEARTAAIDAVLPVAVTGVLLLAVFAWYVHRNTGHLASLEGLAERLRQASGAEGRAEDPSATISGAIAVLEARLAEAAAAARRSADACARLEERLSQRGPAAETVVGRFAESAQRARLAADRAGSIVREASEAGDAARHAAECGANALGDVAQIDAGVQAVIVRGRDLSERLEAMRDRAATVDAALEAMVQVANRSSVLSLNAEIEASQAGEAGRGFSVVAREIRRLAEQAAANSMEIERNVRALHEALQAGRKATTDFAKAAEEASERSARLSASMAEGIQRIQSIGPRVQSLGERGESLRHEGEALAAGLRDAQSAAAEVSAFLAECGPALRDARMRAAEAAGDR